MNEDERLPRRTDSREPFFVVAEQESRSDAGTGDSPKSTDDSLTDFLRGSLFCSKMGLRPRSQGVTEMKTHS